jgi:chromosome segregation ATPase
MSGELAGLRAEREALALEAEEARATSERLAGELERARTDLSSSGRERVSLERAHAELTRRFEEVADELERATDDIEMLRDETSAGPTDRLAIGRPRRARQRPESDPPGSRHETFTEHEEYTAVAAPTPALAEWMRRLEGAIADLRLQVRAASNEAATLRGDPDSVGIINAALFAAAERVENAREAVGNIVELFELVSTS